MRNTIATSPVAGEVGKAYTPQHIANYFLDRAAEEGRPLTPLKLIKLVYIAYGWVLALLGRKLFVEPIEAWRHGPVVPSLYHEFKHFEKSPITDRATQFDFYTMDGFEPRVDDSQIIGILDKVWAAYHRFSGWALREKTHEPETPWDQTYRTGQKNAVIEDNLIAPHFRAKIRQILDAAGA